MARSSLLTASWRRNLLRWAGQVDVAFDTSTGHDHDGTDSKSITASVTYGTVGQMAAAGTAASNAAGTTAASARIDHVHALGTHVHDGATTGGATLGDHTSSYIILANTTLPAGTSAYIGRDNAGDVTVNALTGKTVNIAVAGTDVVAVSGSQVTITGNLSVSGTFGITGNWDVAATLTVDELILDTDGVAPAGTNAYAVSDNTGDFTVNALTGKTFNIAINGSDEYTFSATVADFLGNAIDNAGYLILNAATAPAGTEVYGVNDNTGDLTFNALSTKAVHIAVAGVDEVDFSATAHVFNEASNDRDFRVETGGLAYAIYADGGKDALVLGANTDLSDANHLIHVGRLARTATDATSYADLWMQPAGAVTTTGVTPVVATAYFLEPNITIGGGSVTDATVIYAGAAPTEGGNNYSVMAAGAIGLIADAADIVIGAGRDVLMRWSTADADNHAFAIGLGASKAIHIADAADIATDWNVAAASNPTFYIHGSANPATEYVALSTDETDAHLNAVGANWKIEIGGTAELTISASAVNLAANTLQGGTAASGDLVLQSTSDATKGFITVAATEPGIVVGGTGASVDRATNDGTNCVHLFNGTAPIGAMTNGVSLYSSGGEFYAMDAAGNATLNSPHSADGDLIIHHYNARQDKTIRIHLEKLLKKLGTDPAYGQYFEEIAGLKHNKEW